MKRILFYFTFLLSINPLFSQIDTLFFEGFDSPNSFPTNWKVSNTYTPLASRANFWWKDSVIFKSGNGAAADTVGNRNTAYLTTPKISLRDSSGNLYPFVAFNFDQICYINSMNQLFVEYKFGDSLWKQFPNTAVINGIIKRIYNGSNIYFGPTSLAGPIMLDTVNHYFNKFSSPVKWHIRDSAFIFTTFNSVNAWSLESFDVGEMINWEVSENGFPISTLDSVQFRIALYDSPYGPIRDNGLHQSYIDNLAVLTALSVGQSELDKENQLKLYPNPSKDYIQIKGLDEFSQYQYRIYSIEGKIIEEDNLQNNEISLRKLESGIYFLEVFNSKERRVQKFIKE